MEPAKSKTEKLKRKKRGDDMNDELLHGAGSAQTHVTESWAPIVIDDRTLSDWGKLSPEPAQPETSTEEQQIDAA